MVSRRSFLWSVPTALGLGGLFWFFRRKDTALPEPSAPKWVPPAPAAEPQIVEVAPPEVHPITEAEAAFATGLRHPGPVHPTKNWVVLPSPDYEEGLGDGGLEIWNLDSAALIGSLPGSANDMEYQNAAWIASGQRQRFTLDGRTILSSYVAYDLRIVGGADLIKREIWTREGSHGIEVLGALYPFSTDPQQHPSLACGNQLLDPDSGGPVLSPIAEWVLSCQAVSADGRWAAGSYPVSSDGSQPSVEGIAVWDVRAGLCRAVRRIAPARLLGSLSMDPSGAWAAWTEAPQNGGPAEIVLWHWTSSRESRISLPPGMKSSRCAISLESPDRLWMSWVENDPQGSEAAGNAVFRTKAMPSGPERQLGCVGDHYGDTAPAQVAPQGAPGTVVIRYGSGTIRSYGLDGSLTRVLTAYLPKTHQLAWGADPNYLLVGRNEVSSSLWDRKGKVIKVPGQVSADFLLEPPVFPVASGGLAVAKGPGGLLAVGSPEGGVLIQDAGRLKPLDLNAQNQGKGPTPLKVLGDTHAPPLRAIVFLGTGPLIAGLRADGALEIWNAESGAKVNAFQSHPRGNALISTPDGSRLCSGGHDGVKVWNAATGKLLLHLDTETHWVCGLAISPDGGTLIASLVHGRLRAWNVADGKPLWTITAHDGWGAGVSVHPTKPWVASGGEDGRVALWDLRSGLKLKETRAHGHSVAWSHDGAWLAVSGLDRVRVLKPDLSYEDVDANRLNLDWADEYT